MTALLLALAGCEGGAPTSGSGGASQEQPSTADLTTSSATSPSSQCALAPSVPSYKGDLVGFLRETPISQAGSEALKEPSSADLLAFERTFAELLSRGPTPTAVESLKGLGYEVVRYQQDNGSSFLVVRASLFGTGQGTFVINQEPARDLWLEAPHADSDDGTLRQSAEALVSLGARALLITGSNRCATAVATPCDGTSKVCGGSLKRSDAAHFAGNYFTSAHRALRSVYPSTLAVSVHGMETEGVEAAVISDGTRSPATSGLSQRLRDALNARLPSGQQAFSCNDPSDDGRFRPLCGTTNVQGRIDNGSGDACRTGTTSASGRFLHVEQGANLRPVKGAQAKLPGTFSAALGDVVACTLGGNGQGCTPVAYACR